MSAIKFVEYRDFLNVRKFCLQKMWAYQGHAPCCSAIFRFSVRFPQFRLPFACGTQKQKKEGKKEQQKIQKAKMETEK